MSSLLAFAWRNKNFHSEENNDLDFHPGVVSASSSGETLGLQPSEDSMEFDMDQMPQTPQGLRTRTSPDSIRAKLGLLPKKKIEWTEPERKTLNQCLDSTSSSLCSALPPFHPSSNSVTSPQVSTSSFYTRSSAHSSRHIAQSPTLEVGQAKTAVGALLALSDAKTSFHDRTQNSMLSHGSILPPRQWDKGLGKKTHSTSNDETSMNSQKILPSPQPTEDGEDESFAHASPSSNYWRNNPTSWHGTRQVLETSFSRSFHIHTFEDSAGTESELNVSGISTRELESLHSLVDDAVDEDILSTCEDIMTTSDKYAIDSNKDDLLFSMIERLQDDTQLVMEILDTATQHTTTDTTFKFQEENFIKGFSKENRGLLVQEIDEMQNEETIMEPTHVKCKQALAFCIALTRTAVPESEKPTKLQSLTSGVPQHGRWKCIPGFRAAIGLDEEPKSPETIRGGDTSLFSLPSESATDITPHTSNVSVTTTITSAFSPEKNERLLSLNPHRRNLRKTLDTIATLLDRLGALCVTLLSKPETSFDESSNARGEITRIYLQLQKISVEDLESLIDSFELDIMPAPILRIISEDNGENQVPTVLQGAMPLPSVNDSHGIPAAAASHTLPVKITEDGQDCDNHLFSPSTADMMSIEISASNRNFNEDDDLRRTVGSFDSEESSEAARDPSPPAVGFENQLNGGRIEKKKSIRRMWKRKLSRKKAAE